MRSSSLERLLTRSFVVAREDDLFAIHEILCTSVRLQDAATTHAWSAQEWADAETRIVTYWDTHLHERTDPV